MTIYEYLLKVRRPHLITTSREYNYYLENIDYLNEIPDFLPFVNPKDEFTIIASNILIEGVKATHAIRLWYESGKKDKIENIVPPAFKFQDVDIFCPLYSVSTNLLIANGRSNILSISNDSVHVFETYNFALYGSSLTSLVYLTGDDHSAAYYHYDFHTIYIINDQGLLDVRISLFDRYLDKPDFRNIIERIKPVLHAYYNLGRSEFLNALKDQKLISPKVFNELNTMRKGKK